MSSPTSARSRSGASWTAIGGSIALLGLTIILWPERGLMPHPLTFPPSESTRPIAGYAVFGYPLLCIGLCLVIGGMVRRAISTTRRKSASRMPADT